MTSDPHSDIWLYAMLMIGSVMPPMLRGVFGVAALGAWIVLRA